MQNNKTVEIRRKCSSVDQLRRFNILKKEFQKEKMDGNFYQINHIRQIPIARVSKFKSIHLVPKTMYFLKFT